MGRQLSVAQVRREVKSMSYQERVAGSNYTIASCGHPVRPGEASGDHGGVLLCAPCEKQFREDMCGDDVPSSFSPLEEPGT
jgi:hypothetical protein